MKALICGISGQDGAYLAKLLLENGYEVYGSSRDAQTASFTNLKTLGIDKKVVVTSIALNDFRSVLQALQKIDPDEIYNLAGQSSVGLSFEQPVETLESITVGVLNLLEAIRFMGSKMKLYNAGSSECFGDTGGVYASESSLFRPRSPYAVAKSSAHWLVANYREAYDLFACSGILFNHESPLRPVRFVTRKIISSACRIAGGSEETLRLGNISIIRDWGWAPEYVRAMWLMMQRDNPEDFVIATGKSISLKCFIEITFSQLGLNWENYVSIDSTLMRPTDIQGGYADPSKARKLLGWEATYNVEDVIREMIFAEQAEATRN